MNMPDLQRVYASVWVTPFVGKAITFFRELRNMSPKELAAATNLDLSAIRRLEAGRKQGGWVMSVEVVCKALGISLEQLFHQARREAEMEALRTFFSGHKK